MTILRWRTARQIENYPDTPVVYRRPILRFVLGAFVIGSILWFCVMILNPPPPSDALHGSDWPLPIFLAVLLGGGYMYVSARLVVDRTHVRIFNPLRRVNVPIGHVTDVDMGSNLTVKTEYGQFTSWGVEAANAQIASGQFGTQTDLAGLILAARATAGNASDPPVKYHWCLPAPLVLVAIIVAVAESIAILLTAS